MNPRHVFAVGAIGLTVTFPAAAIDNDESIVVTATRFSEPNPGIPANISVISQQDIRTSPAQNLPDLLSSRAGINISSLGGVLGKDATVDMRGFGSTATSNTLILLDGQRVNPVDMGTIIWSSIPLESVQRIEIIRGSGTVLYGDGATGGVVNIITNKSGNPVAGVSATTGSFGYRGADVQLSNGNDSAYYNLVAKYADTDGYRQNGQQSQQNASGRVGLLLDHGEIFTDFAIYQESAGLPGSVSSTAYRNDPRSTKTPKNSEDRDGYRIRPGISYHFNDRLSIESEIAVEHQELDSKYVSYSSSSNRLRDTLSFTPRLRWRHDLDALPSETVFGFDYYDGKVDSSNVGFANAGASQTSDAFYLQNITSLIQGLSLTVGGRSQRMKQDAHQDAYAPFFSPAMQGEATRRQSAYDLGLAYAADRWRLYGKTGTTFRFANLDELFGSDAFGNPVFSGDLKPQHGQVTEIGGNVSAGPVNIRASLYQMDLTDEIGYDASLYANVNFDPTRRKGGELEADWKISDSLSSKFSYAYTDATFRSGNYAGNEIPLVPRNQANTQLTWNSGKTGTYSAIVKYVGERRYGSDFSNAQSMLSGYTTLDLQAIWDAKPITVTAKVFNVADVKYSPFAGYSAFSGTYYYPADGRSFYISARYDF